jgi:hypothetical protein
LNGGSQIVMRRYAIEQCRIGIEQIDNRAQTRRERAAHFRRRLEQANRMAGISQQKSDAVAHQPATDHADFLTGSIHFAFTPASDMSNGIREKAPLVDPTARGFHLN